MNRILSRFLSGASGAMLAAALVTVSGPARAGEVLFVSDSMTDAVNIPLALSGGSPEVAHPTIAGAAFRPSAGGPNDHDVTIIRNDYAVTGGVVFAAEGTNPALAGARAGVTLADYCSVVWSASGPHQPDTFGGGLGADGGLHTDPDVFASLMSYVADGGYVLVTGHDAAADPADPQMESFIGGAGAIAGEQTRIVPNSAPFGSVFGFNNTLAGGVTDISGSTPGIWVPGGVNTLDGVQDLDYVASVDGMEVTPVMFEPLVAGASGWTERVPAVNGGAPGGADRTKGRIAYIANGVFLYEDLPFNPGTYLSDGEDASWIGDPVYKAALVNFAYNACAEPVTPPPDAPTNLQARAKGSLVNLTWTASPDADTYNVQRKLDTEAVFSQVGSVTGTVFADTLPPGTASAEYFVEAENANGVSDPSNVITVMPTSRR